MQNKGGSNIHGISYPRFKLKKRRAVLLEYAILLCSILPLVFAASAMIYKTSLFGGEFGIIGQEIVHFYQRITTIISLPIP